MSAIRTGWYCITGHGEAIIATSEQEARALATEHGGMPAMFVHADDIAAFKAS